MYVFIETTTITHTVEIDDPASFVRKMYGRDLNGVPMRTAVVLLTEAGQHPKFGLSILIKDVISVKPLAFQGQEPHEYYTGYQLV